MPWQQVAANAERNEECRFPHKPQFHADKQIQTTLSRNYDPPHGQSSLIRLYQFGDEQLTSISPVHGRESSAIRFARSSAIRID